MSQLRSKTTLTILAALASLSFSAPAHALLGNQFPAITINELITMPDNSGHTAFISGINGAKTSIDLEMFRLTDDQVINALIAKAQTKTVRIRIILDGNGLKGNTGQKNLAALKAAGIDIRPSSPAFSITHEKSMVIDDQYAFITSINLTNTATNTRDYGIITSDAGVIQEMDSVFTTDMDNATNGTGNTPNLTNPNLVWSPVNSEAKLVTLIGDAQKTILATVESLTDDTIIAALGQAAARGVQVFMIVPECDDGDALLDYPAVTTLLANHINVRVMPEPRSFDLPYMHAKTIVADDALVYIGSINYSWNSTQKARELGVIFYNQTVAAQITQDYNIDWAKAVAPPANPSATCQAAQPQQTPN